jgi:hypothetical protein
MDDFLKTKTKTKKSLSRLGRAEILMRGRRGEGTRTSQDRSERGEESQKKDRDGWF